MGPPPTCQVCLKCGSTLADAPERHADPEPHRWYAYPVRADQPDATLTRCTRCNRIKREVDQEEEERKAGGTSADGAP